MNKKEMIFYGMKKGIPVVIGYIPMGIGYAALAIKAGLTSIQTVSMSFFVFAGAGQILAVTMLAQGSSFLAIVLTNFFVNLRYFLFNIAVFNKMEDNSTLSNVLTAHLVVDESFAIFSFLEESSMWVYIGLAGISFLSWVLGAAIGVTFLRALPEVVTNSFNISLYALFVAILFVDIQKSRQIAYLVIITGAVHILLSYLIGTNWSLVLSILIGAGIGMYIVDDEVIFDEDKTLEEVNK